MNPHKKNLDKYLTSLEERLEQEELEKLFQQLPSIVENIIALAGPVTGPSSSGSSTQFVCPHCKKTLTVK